MSDDLADDRWTAGVAPKGVRDQLAEAVQRQEVPVGSVMGMALDAPLREERALMD